MIILHSWDTVPTFNLYIPVLTSGTLFELSEYLSSVPLFFSLYSRTPIIDLFFHFVDFHSVFNIFTVFHLQTWLRFFLFTLLKFWPACLSCVVSNATFFGLDSKGDFFSVMVLFYSSVSLMSSVTLYIILLHSLTIFSWSLVVLFSILIEVTFIKIFKFYFIAICWGIVLFCSISTLATFKS